MHFKKPTAAVLAAILLFALLLAGCQDTLDTPDGGGTTTDATSTAATSAAISAGVPSDWQTTTTTYSFADDDPVNKAPAKE